MKELIAVEPKEIGLEVVQSVYARALYDGLGLRQNNWARWSEENIEKNEFFLEGEDWEGFLIKRSGNETKDYSITLDFAKHLIMMAKTENSHLYRNYMLECEKRANLANSQNLALSEERTREIAREIAQEEMYGRKIARSNKRHPILTSVDREIEKLWGGQSHLNKLYSQFLQQITRIEGRASLRDGPQAKKVTALFASIMPEEIVEFLEYMREFILENREKKQAKTRKK